VTLNLVRSELLPILLKATHLNQPDSLAFAINLESFPLENTCHQQNAIIQLFVLAYMHDMLHWLPVAQRISHRVAVMVWQPSW